MILLWKFRNFFSDQSGASAVEFALVSPILIFMLVVTIDAGFYIKERMQLQNAAQAAAEYVAQAQDDANVQTVADEVYAGDFATVTLTSEFSCECSDGVAQQCPVSCGSEDYQRRFVTVTAARDYEPLFPYPLVSQSLDLQAAIRVRVD